jgi:hypothetical protein
MRLQQTMPEAELLKGGPAPALFFVAFMQAMAPELFPGAGDVLGATAGS